MSMASSHPRPSQNPSRRHQPEHASSPDAVSDAVSDALTTTPSPPPSPRVVPVVEGDVIASVALAQTTPHTPRTPLETARWLLNAHGIHCINYRLRHKGPTENGWQQVRAEGDELTVRFGRDTNMGVLLGEASGNLADVDLDCPEAIQLADLYLPETGLTWGRGGAVTHRLYRIEEDTPPENRVKCELARATGEGSAQASKQRPEQESERGTEQGAEQGAEGMLVELRYHRHQSMCPPSLHPGGDQLVWRRREEPAVVRYSELRRAVRRLAATILIARRWPDPGMRHGYVLALAGVLAHRALPLDEAAQLIANAGDLAQDGDPADRAGAVRGTYDRHTQGQPISGIPTLKEYLTDGKDLDRLLEWLDLADDRLPEDGAARLVGADGFALTDIGNAERLIHRHGAQMRWVHEAQGWYVWDGVRWGPDHGCRVSQWASATLRATAALAHAVEDEQEGRLLLLWAVKSEDGWRPDTMLKRAREQAGVTLSREAFDQHPWLLNCRNGVVDLRTGMLLPHDPSFLLTHLAPVDYDPSARSSVWDAFLARVLPDAELRAFVQRAVGYSLTGLTTEEVLFLLVGPTRTGKSTFLTSVTNALGDYGKTTSFETFLRRENTGGIRNDLARLAGARFVMSSEVDEGKRLAEALIKTMTGGDKQTARFLRQEFFEFTPEYALWLAVNHHPQVSGSDDALWERILQIPFEVALTYKDMPEEERKRGQAHKLTLINPAESGAAILAWAVEGCLAWQHGGLHVPEVVRQATATYRDDMLADDPVQMFIDDCVTPGTREEYVTVYAMNQTYNEWVNYHHIRYAPGRSKLIEALDQRGFWRDSKNTKDGTKRVWRGVRQVNALGRAEESSQHITPFGRMVGQS